MMMDDDDARINAEAAHTDVTAATVICRARTTTSAARAFTSK